MIYLRSWLTTKPRPDRSGGASRRLAEMTSPFRCCPHEFFRVEFLSSIPNAFGLHGLEVVAAVRCVGITSAQTSIQSPWQNGVAERWVGSCRRELLDHTIVLDERHLKRLLSQYVRYYQS